MNNEEIGNTTIALKRAQPQAPKQNRQNKTFNRTSTAPISESTRPHPKMCVIYRTDHIYVHMYMHLDSPHWVKAVVASLCYNQMSNKVKVFLISVS